MSELVKTPEQVELTNLRGEVEFLRALVYALLDEKRGNPAWSAKVRDSIAGHRNAIPKPSPELVAFDHAHGRNPRVF